MNMKIAPWPFFDSEQIESVKNVLESGKVNKWTGNICHQFENQFSNNFNCKYSISVANGTLALYAAYSALNLCEGDEVITTPRTFIATASTLLFFGVKPVFADVDINSGCITAGTIKPLINKKTKLISVVHLGGWPADMIEICKLAKENNLKVLEDCSQAHGASINGKSVGSFGDISVWSFCQDKIITTGGEGGMITTSNESLFERIWSIRDHGKTLEALNREKKPGFKWLHDSYGLNLRLTEMQSAIGIIQLERLKSWNKLRYRNALTLADCLRKFSSVKVPFPGDQINHAWYKFYAFIDNDYLNKGWTRDKIISEICSLGFPAFSGSCSEIYNEKCFVNLGFKPSKPLKIAKILGETSIMFLVHPTITLDEMINYKNAIEKVLGKALK